MRVKFDFRIIRCANNLPGAHVPGARTRTRVRVLHGALVTVVALADRWDFPPTIPIRVMDEQLILLDSSNLHPLLHLVESSAPGWLAMEG